MFQFGNQFLLISWILEKMSLDFHQESFRCKCFNLMQTRAILNSRNLTNKLNAFLFEISNVDHHSFYIWRQYSMILSKKVVKFPQKFPTSQKTKIILMFVLFILDNFSRVYFKEINRQLVKHINNKILLRLLGIFVGLRMNKKKEFIILWWRDKRNERMNASESNNWKILRRRRF